jgi:hypothetical protein
MNDFNTIKARHFYFANGELHFKGKEYSWHIPKHLRALNIQKDDIVRVSRHNDKDAKVMVVDVYRENREDTGKTYANILGKVERREQNGKDKPNTQSEQSESNTTEKTD